MNTNTLITLFLVCGLLCSCDKINPVLEKADSIEITFYGKEADKINTSYRKMTITYPARISEIIGYITGSDAPLYKCAYNGNITFLKEGRAFIENAEFNISQSCPHIIFYIKGELISKEITNEGLQDLKNLYKQHVAKEHWLVK